MNGLASIVILTVIFCGVQGQAMMGNCTVPVYVEKIQPCQTTFIHELQKNPKSNCSAELQEVIKCSVKVVKSCFSSLGIPDADLTSIMQKTLTKDLMCNKAGLQVPGPSGMNATLPCDISVAEYTNRINNCSNKLVKMWQTNRADPGACMEYKMTKECIRKVIKDANCKTKTGEFEEMVKISLGKYNPFCSTNVDPTSAPGQTTQSPTGTQSPNGTQSPTGSAHPGPVGPTSASPQTSYFLFMLVTMLVVFSF